MAVRCEPARAVTGTNGVGVNVGEGGGGDDGDLEGLGVKLSERVKVRVGDSVWLAEGEGVYVGMRLRSGMCVLACRAVSRSSASRHDNGPHCLGHRAALDRVHMGRAAGGRAHAALGTTAYLRFGGAGRDVLEGGGYPPPPSRAPSLCPATVPLTPSASINGIRNRQ